MSTDQRVIAAREFLTGARRRKVDELPPSVLMREDAELRRLLGQALDVITDYEDEELDSDVTQVTVSGGAYLAPADVRTLGGALADAIAHSADPGTASAYRALAGALGIEAPR